MSRIIATCTNDDLGLIGETEVITASEELKKVLVSVGYAVYYDDTKPLPGKHVNVYESGLIYPPDRQIVYNDSLWMSNTTTSTTWVLSEWDILITGTAKV